MSGDLSGPRLLLRSITDDDVDLVLGGRRSPQWDPDFPAAGDRDIARLRARVGLPHGPDLLFGPRLVVERMTGLVIGSAGFFGPPEDGVVEIGYGVVPGRQGRGYASEAVGLLLDAMREHPGVATVTATVEAGNTASVRVLERAGFALVASTEAELRYAVEVTATGWSPPTG